MVVSKHTSRIVFRDVLRIWEPLPVVCHSLLESIAFSRHPTARNETVKIYLELPRIVGVRYPRVQVSDSSKRSPEVNGSGARAEDTFIDSEVWNNWKFSFWNKRFKKKSFTKEDIIIPEAKPTNLRYNKASYNREA